MRCLTLILLVMALGAGLPHSHAGDMPTTKMRGKPYVWINDICDFYKFKKSSSSLPTTLKGPYGTVELTKDDRKIYIKGSKAWLSFSVLQGKKGLYISETDIQLLFDPVLRPEESVPRKKVKGVVIDPGHGGADRGARDSAGYTEKAANLFTARELKKLLEADGIDVVMTRERDVFKSLWERVKIANRYPDHIFISIHYNSVHVRSANGIETFSMTPRGAGSTSAGGRVRRSDYKKYGGNRYDPNNALLMKNMHKELMTMHTKRGDRGLKRARFLVLREVKIPAVLVEGGFMSHYIDSRLIRSESYKRKVAAAVYRGTKEYIAMMNSPMLAEGAGLKKKPVTQKASTVKTKSAPLEVEKKTEVKKKSEPVVQKTQEESLSESEKTEVDSEKPSPQSIPLRGGSDAAVRDREREIIERLKKALDIGKEEDSSKESSESAAPVEESSQAEIKSEALKSESETTNKAETEGVPDA